MYLRPCLGACLIETSALSCQQGCGKCKAAPGSSIRCDLARSSKSNSEDPPAAPGLILRKEIMDQPIFQVLSDIITHAADVVGEH
jgi:hypothetical protein